jgi:hypothetical protein
MTNIPRGNFSVATSTAQFKVVGDVFMKIKPHPVAETQPVMPPSIRLGQMEFESLSLGAGKTVPAKLGDYLLP